MTRKLAVLDAPCDPVYRSSENGRDQRQRELLARIGARDAGSVDVSPCAEDATSDRVQRFTEALAGRVRELVGAREFPVVLGGHCHILLGNMLGLRSLGRYGLVFVDGYDDFARAGDDERHRGFFAAAGLDLAIVTGNGPDTLSNLRGLKPYVDERHVVLFGMHRDPADAMLASHLLDASPIEEYRLERIREVGAAEAALQALRFLEAQPLAGFWIHVDADVLDRSAADSSAPGRLDFDELTEALRVFLGSERAAGLELTIDDPELDPEGIHGDRLVDSVVRAFLPHG